MLCWWIGGLSDNSGRNGKWGSQDTLRVWGCRGLPPADSQWQAQVLHKFGAYAGQGETKPIPVEEFIKNKDNKGIEFLIPPEPDVNYRLFSYVYDGQGHVGVVNIPFHVSEE